MKTEYKIGLFFSVLGIGIGLLISIAFITNNPDVQIKYRDIVRYKKDTVYKTQPVEIKKVKFTQTVYIPKEIKDTVEIRRLLNVRDSLEIILTHYKVDNKLSLDTVYQQSDTVNMVVDKINNRLDSLRIARVPIILQENVVEIPVEKEVPWYKTFEAGAGAAILVGLLIFLIGGR